MEGYVPTSTDITLYPSWNMIGLPSESAGNHGLPAEVTRIGYFDATLEYNVAYSYDPASFEFEPGQGYWMFFGTCSKNLRKANFPIRYNGDDEAVVWTIHSV